MSKGEDKLFEKNRQDVSKFNESSTEAVKKKLELMERVAKLKQTKLDFEIKSI